jgi:hypothetical protein
MSTAPAKDVERLARTLGMLGSDHDGELIAAARAANRQIKALGLDWREVVARAFRPAPTGRHPTSAAAPPGPKGAHDQIAECLAWPGLLSAWETGFLTSLRVQRTPLSPKQAAKLAEVVERLQARTAARARP